MESGLPVLTFYNLPGFAEQIRVTFAVGNVKYVDRRISLKDPLASSYKGFSPSGRIPTLEVDGRVLTESQAIIYYAAYRGDLLPSDRFDQDTAFALQSLITEFYSYLDLTESSAASSPSTMPHKLQQGLTTIWDTKGPNIIERIEAMINPSETSGWLFGDRISYADIALNSFVRGMIHHGSPRNAQALSNCPKIKLVTSAVNAHPAVVAYRRLHMRQLRPKLYTDQSTAAATIPIRWIFEIGNVQYEDHRISTSEEGEPPRHLPALELPDDRWLTEPQAILIHAARLANLIPSNQSDFAHALSILHALAPIDLLNKLLTADHTVAAHLNDHTAVVPSVFKRLDALVAQHQSPQGYIVGDRLSFADIVVAYHCSQMIDHSALIPNVLSQSPHCNKVFDLIRNHPAVRSQVLREGQTPKLRLLRPKSKEDAQHLREMLKFANIDFEEETNPIDTSHTTLILNGHQPISGVAGCLQCVAELTHLDPHTLKGRCHALSLLSLHQSQSDLHILDNAVGLYQDDQTGYCVDNRLTYIDFFIAYNLKLHIESTPNWEALYPRLAKLYHAVITNNPSQ